MDYKRLDTTEPKAYSLPRELIGGVLSSLIVLVLNVVSVTVIFHDGYLFSSFLGKGATLAMLCTAVGPALQVARSGLPVACVSDTFMAALYADMASNILRHDLPSPQGTLFLAMGACTAISGGCYLAIGVARVGKIVQFVPAPIMSGYLASTGYVQLHSSSRMVTGCGLLELECLASSPLLPYLSAAVCLGLALYVIRKHTHGLAQTLLIPGVAVIAAALFQATRLFLPEEWLAPLTLQLPQGATAFSLLDGLDLSRVSSLRGGGKGG